MYRDFVDWKTGLVGSRCGGRVAKAMLRHKVLNDNFLREMNTKLFIREDTAEYADVKEKLWVMIEGHQENGG